MLDYRAKVFRAVAEKLNFTRASEQLHISQPAVTQHIKALEEHYGTALFHRSPGGIRLTAAGQSLLKAVIRGCELEHETELALRSRQTLLAGPLRIGSSTTVAQYFLPAPLGRFQQEHPKVDVSLQIGNTQEIADSVRNARLDVGLVEGPGERRDLHAEDFFQDEIVCVAAPSSAYAKKQRLAVEDLAAAPLVMREPGSGTRDVTERALRKEGLRATALRVVLETESTETIKGLVASGVGLGFISRLAVANEVTLGKLAVVPIARFRIPRDFTFLYPQGPRPSGAVGAFMDSIRDRATAKT
ncbi:LysR family transcriptional regulator [Opitutaceae bacterium EW11]|nr:LysR family transcriptional regulator [Opitutaceae bacterium EW11]